METVRNIVLLAGQGNMVGYNTQISDLASRWRTARARTVVWVGGRWVPLRPGAGYQSSGYGPEISMAQELLPELPDGSELAFIKVARKNASLSHDWNPSQPGNLFDELVRQTRAAMQAGPVRIWGLLWLQGAADSVSPDQAMAYTENFNVFVTRLRAQLGVPDLPVIAGLLDAPEKTHPYGSRVRRALSRCRLAQTHAVNLSDMELGPDNIHLTPKAVGKLGRRFAWKLMEIAKPSELLIRKWLWSGENYHAWYEGPVVAPDRVVVSFPYAEKGDATEKPPFGQEYFSKKKVPTVYIRFRTADWFQSLEVFDLAWAIRDALGPQCNIVTYGVSMGGYGALLLSDALKAQKVIAIAPQFTIDRSVFPWEHRWSWASKVIGPFIHDVDAHVSSTAQKYVFYDGFSLDRHHVNGFKTDQSWHLVSFPNASHQIMRFLKETETLPLLMQNWFSDGPNIEDLCKQSRLKRRQSPIYLLTFAKTSGLRWPMLAKHALDLCEDINGPKGRIDKDREILARLHPNELPSVA